MSGGAVWVFSALLFLLPGSLSAQSTPSVDQPFDQGLLSVCDHAAQYFIEKFRSRLQEAQVRGPEAVLKFFARDLAEMERGFSNSRIKLRLMARHPASRSPKTDVFDQTAMSGFARAGKKSAGVVGFFINPQDQGRHYRFYREVRIQESCMTCHGPKNTVKAELKDLFETAFPGFHGFGYRTGEVMGAVGIRVRNLPAP